MLFSEIMLYSSAITSASTYNGGLKSLCFTLTVSPIDIISCGYVTSKSVEVISYDITADLRLFNSVLAKERNRVSFIF